MGNANQATRLGIDDCIDLSTFYGQPLSFHSLHSENIQLLHGHRRAKRINGCKGICFGSRPIFFNEYIYIRIIETSSLPGALRFGFMSDDPITLNPADLASYVCPDLTNEQGYWAKAVPETVVQRGSVVFFRLSPDGNVMYGVNGNEKGVFFGRVQMNSPIWCLMDLYGSTMSVEFEDGMQMSHSNMCLTATSEAFLGSGLSNSNVNSHHCNTLFSVDHPQLPSASIFSPGDSISPASGRTMPFTISREKVLLGPGSETLEVIDPMPFHFNTVGRNIHLSHDSCVASRMQHEYCNGYVFTHRPVKPGEKLLISIVAVSSDYVGGLAFGMTSCNPIKIKQTDLPDDSDMLLDWSDYWVVHKDVYVKPEVSDELGFYLTQTGEVRYTRNGCPVGTLMHVDCSLPLWAFFDIYGSTRIIKSLGVFVPSTSFGSSNNLPSDPVLHKDFLLPVSNISTVSNLQTSNPSISINDCRFTTPTKMLNRQTPGHSATLSVSTLSKLNSPPCQTIRILPRKDIPAVSPLDTLLDIAPTLPLPLIPIPYCLTTSKIMMPPGRPPRKSVRQSLPPPPVPPTSIKSSDPRNDQYSASQECAICMEKASNCALYTCGHMCMCYDCAIDIVANQGALCPICRQPILDVIKIFRS